MKNIKAFNAVLNSSYNNNEKYLFWQSYRNKLTAYMLDHLKNKSVLIIGAGNLMILI